MINVEERESQPVTASQRQPPDFTIWSLITTCVFFNGFGLSALHLAVKSRERWREGHWSEAKRFSLISLVLNILALVLWLLMLVAIHMGRVYLKWLFRIIFYSGK
jgi:nitrate reductase NapE component